MVTRRLAAALALVAACDPGADDREFLVASPRLLAVAAEPAEAPPGASVRLSAIALGPSGPAADLVGWGRCSRRKPLTDLGPVDPGCMLGAPAALVPLGDGPTADLTVPPDACRLFGPDRPDPKPGEPAGRPVDPDPSGGYYLPLRVALTPQVSAAFLRLKCDLDGATQEAVLAFAKNYRPNQNPALDALTLLVDGAPLPTPAGDDPVEVPSGRPLTIEARWPACPAAGSPLAPTCGDGVCSPGEEIAACADDCQPLRGCAGAEEFAVYDPATQQVSLRREELRASWYATAGTLRDDATGATLDRGTSNLWTPPATPGDAWLAVVLRDSRGGAGHRFLHVRVRLNANPRSPKIPARSRAPRTP